MNPNQPLDEHELEASLRSMRPVSSQLDVSMVFYQAGYQAAASQPTDGVGKRASQWLIAAIIGALIIAPASYHAGVSSAQLASEPSAPQPKASDVEQSRQNVDAVFVTNKVAAEDTQLDSSKSPAGLFAFVAQQWFPGNKVERREQGGMLTASLAATQTDERWPDVGDSAVNRFKTFATASAAPKQSQTLAVSDVMNIAESFGDF